MIRANVCPYCGGPYTLALSCIGQRTDTSGQNCCPKMAEHARLVAEAAEFELTEEEERAIPRVS
jgi:hypothetical protein